MQPLAPIVLFVYKRPWHTQQVLNALAANAEAKDSILYVYSDGAKENATEEDAAKIEEVRQIIKEEKRFKEVILKLSAKNKGLSGSVIDGVTEVINKHGVAIILEDDIVPSVGFLRYMNDALSLYSNEDKVGCIHAWNYVLDTSDYTESTFFLKGADCWGWATWKRAWDLFNPDGKLLLESIKSTGTQFDFDRRGTYKFTNMLYEQSNGKVDSWAIRWHASLFLQKKYCLQPTIAIVKNIGLDNSGVHCGISDMEQQTVDFIKLVKLDIKESEWFFKEYNKLLEAENKTIKKSIFNRIKNKLKTSLYTTFFNNNKD